jgi:hypothetical protein
MFSCRSRNKPSSATWFSLKKPKAQKVRMVKTTLTALFDAKDNINQECCPEKTVNCKFYKEVIE